jgi:hypothetical protein
MDYRQFDVVKLVNGVPEDGIGPGTIAVILDVFDGPNPHYEVEVTGTDSLYTMGVAADEIEPAS